VTARSRTAAKRGSDARLVRDVAAGDFRAVARLITLAENDPRAARPHLEALYERTGKAYTVGITGAPGSGKSTLVDALAARYRAAGRGVAILAIDPSSPFSGGAILGDRIRMQSGSTDGRTFIRSMATRGHLGGLARASWDAHLVLDAAGFGTILIETVGVGQDEVEIVGAADATVVLLVPGMGDEVQAMKAGLMEIADVFVINKSDRAGAERLETELRQLVEASSRRDGWRPPIVRTVATENVGIEECERAIADYRRFSESSPGAAERRREIQEARLLGIVRSRISDRFSSEPRLRAELERLAARVGGGEIDPFTAADRLMRAAGFALREGEEER
jgi:LAO/AO transport system kinase